MSENLLQGSDKPPIKFHGLKTFLLYFPLYFAVLARGAWDTWAKTALLFVISLYIFTGILLPSFLRKKSIRINNPFILSALAVFFCLNLVSYAFSAHRFSGYGRLADYGIMFLFALYYSVVERENDDDIPGSLILLPFLVSLTVLAEYMMAVFDSGNPYRYWGIAGVMVNPNFLAFFLVGSIPLLICSFLAGKKLYQAMIVSFALIILIMSGSRLGLLFFILTGAYSFVLWRFSGRLKERTVGLIVAGTMVLAIFFPAVLVFFPAGSLPRSLSDRAGFISTGLEMGIKAPFTGHGPGTYETLHLFYGKNNIKKSLYAHNGFAEIFSETGIIAAVLFYAIFILALYRLSGRLREKIRYMFFFWALAGLFIFSLFDFGFSLPGNMIYSVCLLVFLAPKDKCAVFPAGKISLIIAFLLLAYANARQIMRFDADRDYARGRYYITQNETLLQGGEYLLKSLGKDRNNPDTLFELARFEAHNNRYEAAEIYIGRAIALYPENPRYRYFRGTVMSLAGRKKEEEENYLKARELSPDEMVYQVSLFMFYLKNRDLARVEKLYFEIINNKVYLSYRDREKVLNPDELQEYEIQQMILVRVEKVLPASLHKKNESQSPSPNPSPQGRGN